jgi:hypothetical protein
MAPEEVMVSTQFIDEGHCLLLVGSGTLSGGEIIEATRQLATMPDRLRRVGFVFVDLQSVVQLKMTGAEVREVACLDTQLSRLMPKAVVAIVAPQDYVFGMARMWQALTEETGWTTGVFRSREAAQTWLRLPLPSS